MGGAVGGEQVWGQGGLQGGVQRGVNGEVEEGVHEQDWRVSPTEIVKTRHGWQGRGKGFWCDGGGAKLASGPGGESPLISPAAFRGDWDDRDDADGLLPGRWVSPDPPPALSSRSLLRTTSKENTNGPGSRGGANASAIFSAVGMGTGMGTGMGIGTGTGTGSPPPPCLCLCLCLRRRWRRRGGLRTTDDR